MNTSIVLSKKSFNAAVSRMKTYFSGDRKQASEALSQALYSEDYNITASKLKALPRTSSGVISSMNGNEFRKFKSNVSNLLTHIKNMNADDVYYVQNAKDMLEDFDFNYCHIGNEKLKALLNEIQQTMIDISGYKDVKRLSISGFSKPVKHYEEFERDYSVDASLQTENLMIKWNSIIIAESDMNGKSFSSSCEHEEADFTINDIHFLEWLKTFNLSKEDYDEVSVSMMDFMSSIASCTDSYTPDLNISAELAIMLKNELSST